MSPEIIGILIFVIAVIVGPFATLRAVSHYRARRNGTRPAAKPAKDDPDDKSGFW